MWYTGGLCEELGLGARECGCAKLVGGLRGQGCEWAVPVGCGECGGPARRDLRALTKRTSGSLSRVRVSPSGNVMRQDSTCCRDAGLGPCKCTVRSKRALSSLRMPLTYLICVSGWPGLQQVLADTMRVQVYGACGRARCVLKPET